MNLNLKITVVVQWCCNRGMLNLKTVIVFYSKYCLKKCLSYSFEGYAAIGMT